MKNIALAIMCLLFAGNMAFSDGLILPTYACPKHNIEVVGSKWIAYVGEVYVLEGFDQNTLSNYPPKPDPEHPGKYLGTPTAYIIRMGGANISVPIDSVSLIPPDNLDYEKAAKLNAECVKRFETALAEEISRIKQQQQQPTPDPYAYRNPDASTPPTAAQQQNSRNIWRKGSSLNPNPPATGDEATQQKLDQIIQQQFLQRMRIQQQECESIMNHQ